MEQTECSETSEHKIQTPGNNPEERIQQSYTGLTSREILTSYGFQSFVVIFANSGHYLVSRAT